MARRLRYSRQRALYLGIILTILSIGVLFWSASWTAGVLATTATNVATTFLTLGIVGLLYELVLRDTVMSETLETIGLNQAVASTKLRSIGPAVNVDYGQLCEETRTASILLANPVGWVEKEWSHFLDAAQKRPTKITIYLPDPRGPATRELARRFGYQASPFIDQLKSARAFLESSWRGNRDSSAGFVKGSSINIKLFDGAAAYDIAVFDSDIALFLPQSLRREPGDSPMAFVFKKASTYPAGWVNKQFESLQQLPDDYADEVR